MARRRNQLRPLHRKFLDAYLANGFNGTQAAIAAGYKPSAARFCASRLLTRVNIKSEVEAALNDAGVSRVAVLKAMADAAFRADIADAEDVLHGKVTLKQLRQAGFDTRHIKKMKVSRRVVGGDEPVEIEDVTIELTDRQRALEQLAKGLGMDGQQSHETPTVDRRGPDTQVDGIAFPPGTIPPVPRPDPVQDMHVGTPQRQDDDGQAVPRREDAGA